MLIEPAASGPPSQVTKFKSKLGQISKPEAHWDKKPNAFRGWRVHTRARAWADGFAAILQGLPPLENSVPVVLQVFGLRSGGFHRNGEWLAFVGLEVLAHGRLGEVVAERGGAHKP